MSCFFGLHQIYSISEVKKGLTLFTVNALAQSSFIEEFIVTSEPYWHESIRSFFINSLENGVNTFLSLRDIGITPNTYNKHKTFYTKESAQAYANNCKILSIA